MIFSRFFLTKDFHHRTRRRDGAEDLLVVPAGIELEVSHGDHENVICTLPQYGGNIPSPDSLQFEIPLDIIEERRYETRLIETRPMRSSGLFMMVQTEEG